MASLLRFLALCLLLNLSLPAVAGNSIGKDELDAQKELLLLKIDSGKELAQKDIEAQGRRLDALDKRIDDQVSRVSDIGNAVDRFTAISGWIGILITVLLASGGLVGYFSIRREAKEIAGNEANETASKWFAENEAALRAKIDSLHNDAQYNINNTVQSVHDSAAEAKAAIERVQKNIGTTQTNTSPSPDADKDTETLQRRTNELKAIPENSYSFDDWNTRAFTAYQAGQREEAALYWGKAAKAPAAGAKNAARATFNQAVALGEMRKTDEAIATYNHLIATYADDTAPALREEVARAMNNKAVALGQQGKRDEAIATRNQLITTYADDTAPSLREQVARAIYNEAVVFGQQDKREEAIATYDRLIATYIDDTSPALREQVAKAMHYKAVALEEQGKYDEAITTCDRLIAAYADDAAPALREPVARAMNNKAAVLGEQGKRDEANTTYDRLIATYANDTSSAILEQVARALNGRGFDRLMAAKQGWENRDQALDALKRAETDLHACLVRKPNQGIALGNLAYVQWLLKRHAESKATFHAAVKSMKDGGEQLYKGTLDDIAQHPIPEDAGFKDVVEHLWAEHQAQLPDAN